MNRSSIRRVAVVASAVCAIVAAGSPAYAADPVILAAGSTQQLRTLTVTSLADQDGAIPASVLLILIGLIIAMLVGMLLIQWIIRLGVLVAAVGISPIALALHAPPFTEGRRSCGGERSSGRWPPWSFRGLRCTPR